MLIIRTVLLFAFFLTLSQAKELNFTPQEQAFIQAHPVLRVQNERSWAPIDFRENGHERGYAVDYIKLLASKAGFKLKFYPGRSWSAYLKMLQEDQLDLISSMKITPQRQNYAIFTEEHILELYNSILQHKDTAYSSMKELEGKRVAVVKGYYQEELFRLHYPKTELIFAKNTHEAMQFVIEGKADATIEYHSVLYYNISRYFFTDLHAIVLAENPHFTSAKQYIAIRDDYPLLKSILDKSMRSLTHKELHQIREKWITIIKDRHIKLNKEEENYLRQKKRLRFCSDPDWLPIERIRSGEHIGIAADLLHKISDKMNIRFELVPTQSWAQSLKYLEQKRCDFLSSVIRTDEREKSMDFTSSYLDMSLVISTKSDTFFISSLKNLKDKSIGVVENYAYEQLLKRDYPDVKLVKVKSIYDGLKKVENGEIHAFVDTLEATSEQLRTNSFSSIKISGKLEEKVALSFGVLKGEYLLFDILEKGLESLSLREKKEIYDKWVYVSIDKTDYSLIWKILLAMFILGLFFLYRYKMTLNYNTQLLKINTELEKLNTQLQELSETDQLTQLANRRYLDISLSKEIKQARRYQSHLCIILIDIDFFKKVNDNFGHPTGDRVLKELAKLLKENSREVDTVGRWGGEEFLIILPQTDLTHATTMCEKLQTKIKEHDFELDHTLTASFGISQFQPNSDDESSFLSRVDANLYEAKERGRDRIVTS